MALKLEFSSTFKDADTTLKILNELNKEMKSLQQATQSVGAGEGVKKFEDQMKGFEKAIGSVEGLKKLNTELKQLSALKGDISSFAQSFTDLGKAMNKGLNLASEQSLAEFKKSMTSLKQEAHETGEKLKASLSIVDNAKSTSEEKDIAKAQASGYAANLGQIKSDIKNLELERGMNDPRKFLGGASFSQAIGYAQAAPVVAVAVDRAVEGVHQALLSPYRAEIKNKQLNMSAAQAAMSGDPTMAFLQSTKTGKEQEYEGSTLNWWDKSRGVRMALGATAGALALGASAVATGGTSLLTVPALMGAMGIGASFLGYTNGDEAVANRHSELRGLDMAMYQDVFTPGYQRYRSIYQNNRNLLMQYGDDTVMNNLRGYNSRGITDERAVPVMAALARQGKQVGNKDYFIQTAAKLGLGSEIVEQMARLGNGDDQSTEIIDRLVGGSGLVSRDAQQMLTQGYAGMLSSSNSRESIGNTAGSLTATMSAMRSGTSSSVSDMTLTRSALAMQNKGQGSFSNPFSLGGMITANSLIQLGMNNAAGRAMAGELIAQNRTDQAISFIADATGKDPAEVAKALSGARESAANYSKSLLTADSATESAAKKNKLDIGGYLLNGTEGMDTNASAGYLSALRGDKTTGVKGTDGMPEVAAEGTQKDMAKLQAAQLDAIRDTANKVGVTVSKAIADSFKTAAETIMKASVKAQDSSQVKNDKRGAKTVSPRSGF